MKNPRFSASRFKAAVQGRPVAEVAAAAGVSVGSIANWANGVHEPDATPLALVAALVGKPLTYFYEDSAKC